MGCLKWINKQLTFRGRYQYFEHLTLVIEIDSASQPSIEGHAQMLTKQDYYDRVEETPSHVEENVSFVFLHLYTASYPRAAHVVATHYQQLAIGIVRPSGCDETLV